MNFTENERGQALIEFAFVLPVVLLLITGLFDVARAVWQVNTLAYAAREGTRYAIVRGSSAGSETVDSTHTTAAIQVVKDAAIGIANVTVTYAWPGINNCANSNDRGCPVQVDATAPFVPLPSQYLLGGAFQITMRGGSSLVIQR